MHELWNQDQLKSELSDEDFWALWHEIYQDIQGRSEQEAEGKTYGKWLVIKLHVIPAESVHMILQLVGRSLILKVDAIIQDITRQQVFRRKRMVPVIDYVDAKTLREDPGESTTFG